MAVRVACPGCGTSFTVEPDAAGRIVSCSGCGRKLRLPATPSAPARPAPSAPAASSAPPLAAPTPPAPLDFPADPGPRRRPPRPEVEERPARSLLWLWVLLGTGVVGLAVGAAVTLLTDRPAPPPDVVEEPDREKPAPEPHPAAAATSIPGLKFYLPCDAIEGERVVEGVSGKAVGKLAPGAALIDGPRGKALRLVSPRKKGAAVGYALELKDQTDALAIPADQPFTLSLWVRLPNPTATEFEILRGSENRRNRLRAFHLQARPADVRINLVEPVGAERWLKLEDAYATAAAKWFHVAIVRKRDGSTQTFLDGKPARDNAIPFGGELRYGRLGFLPGTAEESRADIDEFCLFDRALTPAELARLGNRTPDTSPAANEPDRTSAPPGRERYPVPAATVFPGLKFYLPCDAVAGERVVEGVSGKPVGKLTRGAGELIDGPRGKALRLTVAERGPSDPTSVAFDLSDQADLFRFPTNQPFTLSMWVRVQYDSLAIDDTVLNGWSDGGGHLGVTFTRGRVSASLSRPGQTSTGAGGEATEPEEWFHFAVTRSSTGVMRAHIDGVNDGRAKGFGFAFEVRCEFLHLVTSRRLRRTIDLDEFCLYDRVLDDEEIGALAGARPVPVAKPVAGSEAPPPATDFPGLKLYLACDELRGASVRETVADKFVGQAVGAQLVEGPRGKAIRVTSTRGEGVKGPVPGLDLSEIASRVNVPAGKPFTLAFWFREVERDPSRKFSNTLLAMESKPDLPMTGAFRVYADPSHLGTWIGERPRDKAAGQLRGVTSMAKWYWAQWSHVTVVRDEKNTVRWLLNGRPGTRVQPVNTSVQKEPVWDGPLAYEQFVLGSSDGGRTVYEFDEFCLFDRALSDDEINRLGGTKPPAPPRVEPLPVAPSPHPAPPPSLAGMPGLKFYLTGDATADGSAVEAVSGKPVGKGAGVEAVAGIRGNALRLTHTRGAAATCALDLSDQKDAFAVAVGKPFTLAFWIRRHSQTGKDTAGADVLEANTRRLAKAAGTARIRLQAIQHPRVYATLIDTPNSPSKTDQTSAHLEQRTNEPAKWTHLALIRDDKGNVRWLMNGAEAAVGRSGPFTAALQYETIGLLQSLDGTTVIDLDEFCLFDRALSNDEVAALAALKPLPKPPGPAGIDTTGLKVHLAFEEITSGAIREGVTGKLVGKVATAELVDGPRGKAVRLTSVRPDKGNGPTPPAIELNELAGRFDIPAGKPFAVAFWGREVSRERENTFGNGVFVLQSNPDRPGRLLQMVYGVRTGTLRATSSPVNTSGKTTGATWSGEVNPAEWTHFSMVRDENNTVRWTVNGLPVVPRAEKDSAWDGPLQYDQFGLGGSIRGKCVFEIDEFCLFDRVLTSDEIAKLAAPAK